MCATIIELFPNRSIKRGVLVILRRPITEKFIPKLEAMRYFKESFNCDYNFARIFVENVMIRNNIVF